MNAEKPFEGLGKSVAEASAGAPGGRQVFPERMFLTEDGEIKAFLAEARVRAIAREELASLCGLVLRRLQDELDDPERLAKHVVDNFLLRQIFGEALRDFSATPDEPGPKEEPDGA